MHPLGSLRREWMRGYLHPQLVKDGFITKNPSPSGALPWSSRWVLDNTPQVRESLLLSSCSSLADSWRWSLVDLVSLGNFPRLGKFTVYCLSLKMPPSRAELSGVAETAVQHWAFDISLGSWVFWASSLSLGQNVSIVRKQLNNMHLAGNLKGVYSLGFFVMHWWLSFLLQTNDPEVRTMSSISTYS